MTDAKLTDEQRAMLIDTLTLAKRMRACGASFDVATVSALLDAFDSGAALTKRVAELEGECRDARWRAREEVRSQLERLTAERDFWTDRCREIANLKAAAAPPPPIVLTGDGAHIFALQREVELLRNVAGRAEQFRDRADSLNDAFKRLTAHDETIAFARAAAESSGGGR